MSSMPFLQRHANVSQVTMLQPSVNVWVAAATDH